MGRAIYHACRLRFGPNLVQQGQTEHTMSRLEDLIAGQMARLDAVKVVVGDGFEPSKALAGRFTVCPRWPLEYPTTVIG